MVIQKESKEAAVREQESERETKREEGEKDQGDRGRERESEAEQVGTRLERGEGKIGNRKGAQRQRKEQMEKRWLRRLV